MNNDQEINQIPATDNRPVPRFPVGTHIAVLAGFLIFLFALAGGTLSQFFTSFVTPLGEEIADPAPTDVATPIPSLSALPADLSVTAKAAYVYDVESGEVLFSKNETTVLPLASLTKLMTALVAAELVQGDTPVPIPSAAAAQESASGLRVGDELSLQALTTLALVSSANDAAYALGAAVGSLLIEEKPTESFVAAMNIRAQEEGWSTLRFKNTTGLDLNAEQAGAYGSAKDVSHLVEYLLRNHRELLWATTREAVTVTGEAGRSYVSDNTNRLIGDIPGLIGSKTGFTDLAGGNLTVVYDAGFNRPIIVTVLGSTRDGRFRDVTTIIAALQEGN
jgi:D-alanyl-D-alanine carboxypeptidase (penicillin-binding protein 5/6)